MRIHSKFCYLVLLLILGLGVRSATAQVPADDNTIGRDAAELQTDKTLQRPAEQSVVEPDTPELERFKDQITSLLLREKFAEIDNLADSVRSSKARFPGGGWKLSRLYDAVVNVGSADTEAAWQNHLALLQRWAAARPRSITARVALANAYLSYAWDARGSGYGNTVTDEGWRLFHERTEKAQKVLTDAGTLPSKCPHWYYVAQQVAEASGADASQQRAIVEKAIAFEPLYFGYYQSYATDVLPKWGGAPGDAGAFAEESYRRIGGKEGAHIYFEIASNLCGRCSDFSPEGFSWPKIQEGFAATEELYGLNPLKVNRFAFLAATYGDKAAAAKAFQRIGANWDVGVWGTRARFESQRSWSGLPAALPAPQPSPPQLASAAPSPNARVEQMLWLASKESNQGQYGDSTQLAMQAIEIAKFIPGPGTQLGRAYLTIARNESSQHDVVKAQAMLDRAISAIAERSGENSIELSSILMSAALAAEGMSDYQRAEQNLRRAIEIRDKINGPTDPELSNDITTLGFLCEQRGRSKEAIELYLKAITNLQALDANHLGLISPLQNLAMLYKNLGRYAEAESTLQRYLTIMEGHYGLSSPELLSPLSQLASLYHYAGRIDDEKHVRDRMQSLQPRAAN